jgi:hypothetical protein
LCEEDERASLVRRSLGRHGNAWGGRVPGHTETSAVT